MFIFRVLKVIRSTAEASGLRDIDPCSRSILDFVCESETEGRELRVSDIVARQDFGSPPTVYSRVKLLEDTGFLVRLPNANDRRSKSVHLTPRARRVFVKMSVNLQRLSSS